MGEASELELVDVGDAIEPIEGEVVAPLPAALVPVADEGLAPTPLVPPPDQHPALVYLARLPSPHSRGTSAMNG